MSAQSINIVGYVTRSEGEFAQVKAWDGTVTLVPLADVVQAIRELG